MGLPSDVLREITLPVAPVEPDVEFVHSEPGRIAFVGRFEQRKAPEVLIDAMPLVRETVPNARLVLVGRDCARPEHPSAVTWLRQRAEKLGVADALEVVDGWSGPLVVRQQLLRARVFATPSRWESFSYVAAEAAAVGRPVLASDLPGFRDVVVHGATGTLVASNDVEAWAVALTEVLSHDEVAIEFGRSGAYRMATYCDPDRIAATTLGVYENACTIGRSPAASVAA
jgi:glycosyltransferase involved in cell wall biosynthesis